MEPYKLIKLHSKEEWDNEVLSDKISQSAGGSGIGRTTNSPLLQRKSGGTSGTVGGGGDEERIACVDSFQSLILVGTTKGRVIVYSLEENGKGDYGKMILLLKCEISAAKRPIEGLIVCEGNVVVIQCEATVKFYDLMTMENAWTQQSVKGVVSICRNEQVRNEFLVFKRRAAQLFRVSTGGRSSAVQDGSLPFGILMEREIQLQDAVKVSSYIGTHLCLVEDKMFGILDTQTAEQIKLFKTTGEKDGKQQHICQLKGAEFVLVTPSGDARIGGGLGLFVSDGGHPLRGTVEWEKFPSSVLGDYPYLITSRDDGKIEVVEVFSQRKVQEFLINSNNLNLVKTFDCRNLLIVHQFEIYILHAKPRDNQIMDLIKSQKVKEAMELLENGPKITDLILKDIALLLMRHKSFEESRMLLKQVKITAGEFIKEVASDADQSELRFAIDFLMNLNKKNNDDNVNSSILELYCKLKSPGPDFYLFLQNVGSDKTTELLIKFQKFFLLSRLLVGECKFQKAFVILQDLIEKKISDDDFPGPDYYLQLLKNDVNLTKEEFVAYSKWILERSPNYSVDIFSGTTGAVKDRLSESEVLEILESINLSCLNGYLEHLYERTPTQELFERLAMSLLSELEKSENSELYGELLLAEFKALKKPVSSTFTDFLRKHQRVSDEYKNLRLRLMKIIWRQAVIESEQLEQRIMQQYPWLNYEQAVIYARFKQQHDKLFEIFLFQLGDYASAEKHCLEFGEIANDYETNLFQKLFTLYLSISTQLATDLLNNHHHHFDACQVLKLLPANEVDLKSIQIFLLNRLANSTINLNQASTRFQLTSTIHKQLAHQKRTFQTQVVYQNRRNITCTVCSELIQPYLPFHAVYNTENEEHRFLQYLLHPSCAERLTKSNNEQMHRRRARGSLV